MATNRKKTNGRAKRVAWTKEHVRDLKAHSKSKTPVAKISKTMKRTLAQYARRRWLWG
jgi:hypothetical protein